MEELERVRRLAADRDARQELIAFQLAELDRVAPSPGEDDELTALRQVLASAERVERLCLESYGSLYESDQAILASRSRDGGNTWSEPAELTRDTDFDIGLDKQSITADPHDSRFVYAVWDRLAGLTSPDPTGQDFFGPIWFSRTTNGGASWEKARNIFDPGPNAQTIGSIIVVLPNGDLLNAFDLVLDACCTSPLYVAVIRSHDRGAHWSKPVIVNTLQTVGISDPQDGHAVRTGDILPSIAVDPSSGTVYVVWQDSRFNGGARDQIAFSRSDDAGRTWSAPT